MNTCFWCKRRFEDSEVCDCGDATVNRQYVRIAELEGENTLLRKQAEDDQASIRMFKQHVKALRQHRDLFKNKSTHLEAEVARLTAALVECQEAFENGRDVGERAGYGELPF